ncbi:MAG: hypothetical protein IPK26_24965 [Planctomycetes bacterium]|nr:hypothetical protein [Planctomycetota bacterium]
MLRASLLLFACLLQAMPAQTVDTIGGTSSSMTSTGLADGNLFRIDTTCVLQRVECYLGLPAQTQTLTFFVYEHPSRIGTATRIWSAAVQVTGTGNGWYASPTIGVPMVAGNFYAFGVAYSGTATVYWQPWPATGNTTSFGEWVSGKVSVNPPPPTLAFLGTDIAQFRQRITTTAQSGVRMVGDGCNSQGLPPRLVADGLLPIGASVSLHVTDGPTFAMALVGLALGPTSPTPQPFFGCSLWLTVIGPVLAVPLDLDGHGELPLAVPADPRLVGLQFSAQALVTGAPESVTNAVELTVL